mgnify:CR=1 FL=1
MTTFSDSFTGTDGDNLETRSGWTKCTGGSGDTLGINSNHVVAEARNGFQAYYNSAAATVDQDVQKVTQVVSSGKDSLSPCARLNTAGSNCYFFRFSGGVWTLYKRVGGTITGIGTYTGDVPTGAGRVGLLRVTDAAKKLLVDGVERISSADNAVTAAGNFGLATYYGELAANAYSDDYSATDAAAASVVGPLIHDARLIGGGILVKGRLAA